MSKIVNKVVSVGSFGLVKDVTGAEAGEEAAIKAGDIQANAAQAGLDESSRQFDVTTENLSLADQFNREQLGLGSEEAISSLRDSKAGQQAQLSPFANAGVSALEQQQALLGMGTQEQQQQAFNQFSESPGQKFIRERAEKSLVRNSSVIGGLGGGNVRSALIKQGAGFAAQDFNNQFNRLDSLRASGQNAASELGQGELSVGSNIASTQFGGRQAIGSGAINSAANQGQFGQANSANIQQGLNRQGEARASGILGGQQAIAQADQNVLSLGGTVAGMFSDKRLKEDVKKVGEANGFNWYTWGWNSLANELGLFGEDNGVIANEVKEIKPHLVKESKGYLSVNYAGLGV
ncbi:MAG: hypothetical protein Unbinned1520contig1002_10 [Prokaryotic dsDNA virus sp.]|nr:MAG: hypothetical protein Unbinned1520contig1002_10 [Prokaryotic dsDNA virus sp.]|tara:strand:+ start:24783 stop:25829 length:1047 start_codon:yes stop_codon:yes gene_type:complete